MLSVRKDGACLVLTNNRGKFEWGLYGLHKRLQNNAKEFLSGYMREVMHFFPWVERVVREEYRRDSNGNQYKVKVEHFVHHPDEYVKVFNIDLQKHISKWEFESICDLWGTPFHSFQTHHPNCVQGGGGEACEWDGNEMSTETATITHRYSNPLRQSNSIFRSRIISKKKAKELGLCNYPKASRDNDQDVILVKEGVDIPYDLAQANAALQRLNAFCGESAQIHVFILMFLASDGIAIASLQRDYWKGLNKNELLICLGINGSRVEWCEPMSWSDNKTLELKIRSYFIQQPVLNLTSFVAWLRANLKYWDRKQFKDFDYLKEGRASNNYWILLAISFLLSLLLGYLCFTM